MKLKAVLLVAFVVGVQYVAVSAHDFQKLPPSYKADSPVVVNVDDSLGYNYNLKFKKPATNVLHPGIKYITINQGSKTGHRQQIWTPSKQELNEANNDHFDHENRAVVRVSRGDNKNRVLERIETGMRFQENNSITTVLQDDSEKTLTHDYFGTNGKLTYDNFHTKNKSKDSQDYVVETVIVCDKEWGDVFQNDRKKILDYWTVYFWDLNMRYKTLPSSNISFRITSIIVIQNISDQPFVEESRDEDGKAALNVVLGKFGAWIWDQRDDLPKFDMAVAVLKTPISYSAGIAHGRGACRQPFGTVVWGDDGYFNSILAAAHEIAHNLGAPEDADMPGCTSTGYIMSGGVNYTQFHFSECSDRTIADYVRSDAAACLQRIDEPSDPVITPDFNTALAPTMDEQCKKWMGEDSSSYKADCTELWCWKGAVAYGCLTPVEQSPCGDRESGRCFRGKCYSNSSLSFLENVASKQCVLGTDRFSGSDTAQMSDCPRVPSPLNQFRTLKVQRGRHLKILYSKQADIPDVDKCLVGNLQEGGPVGFGLCTTVAGNLSEWALEEVAIGEYLLKEATTKRCAKQEGNVIKVVADCDGSDRNMRWRISLNDNLT